VKASLSGQLQGTLAELVRVAPETAPGVGHSDGTRRRFIRPALAENWRNGDALGRGLTLNQSGRRSSFSASPPVCNSPSPAVVASLGQLSSSSPVGSLGDLHPAHVTQSGLVGQAYGDDAANGRHPTRFQIADAARLIRPWSMKRSDFRGRGYGCMSRRSLAIQVARTLTGKAWR
jgi:hypothetical protein